jgi:transposase
MLAEMLALGSVTEVRVPTRDQEDLRDLSRLRATAAKDLAHARQHVNAVLLRHGIRYPEKTKWTKEHGAWLHRQRFDSPVLQFTYQADVEQAELLAAHLKRIDQRVAAVAKDCQYTPVIDALMCLRGIQVTTAFGLAVEIGDWTRFTGSSIGSYLGLVPSEQSSGQSRHQGPITKAGSKYARKLLIEAAWQHQRPYSRPGERLLRQLDLVAPATRIRALEGNHRLHHNWEVFEARKKRSVTANTAIARELAGWCWSLAAPLQQGERMKAA